MRSTLSVLIPAVALSFVVLFFWGFRSYTISTDFGLHYALMQQIARDLAWPSHTLPNLAEMTFYPPVTHSIAALAGYFTGSPVTGMMMTALVSVFGSYVLLLNLMRFRSTIATIAAMALFLVAVLALHNLNIVVGGEIIQNFYYGQIVAFFIVLLIIQIVFSGKIPATPLAVLAVAITFGLSWVFPMATTQFACASLAYFGIAAIKGVIDRKSEMRNWALLVIMAIALPAAIALHPNFKTIMMIAAHEGGIYLNIPVGYVPTLVLICGLPITVLAIVAVFGRLAVAQPLALVSTTSGVFGAALAQVLALAVGLGSAYGITKHIFPTVTMAAVASCVLIVNVVVKRLGTREHPVIDGVLVAGTALAVIAVVFSVPSHYLGPFIATQRFVASHMPADAFEHTISADSRLLPYENFALTLGDLSYPKPAGVARILGEEVFAPKVDVKRIVSQAPLSYAVLNSDTTPKPVGSCIAASSQDGSTGFVRAPCVGSNTAYSLGEKIEVDQLRKDRPYLRSGWGVVQQDFGVWSLGPTAVLALPLGELPGGDLVLDVDCTAYLSDASPTQLIEVFVADRKVGEWTFSAQEQSNLRSITIPASLMRNTGEITFRLPNASVPPDGSGHAIAFGLKAFRLSVKGGE